MRTARAGTCPSPARPPWAVSYTHLSEAKRLVSARDEFIGNAKKEAESIRRTAEEKARALVDQQEIVRIARTRSSELMTNAENKSRELRHVASDYVDDILRRSEESLAAALNEVRGSRSQFRTATGTPDAQSTQQKLSLIHI